MAKGAVTLLKNGRGILANLFRRKAMALILPYGKIRPSRTRPLRFSRKAVFCPPRVDGKLLILPYCWRTAKSFKKK
jgi:hypothetical protein